MKFSSAISGRVSGLVAVGAVSLTVGCAAAPPPACPEASAAPVVEKAPVAAIMPGTKDKLLGSLIESLKRSGFKCNAGEQTICEKNEFKVAPQAAVDDLPWLLLITSYNLKPNVTCAQAVTAHTEIGSDVRHICNQKSRLATLFSQVLVPSGGLTDADVADLANWFKTSSRTLAALMHERGIVE
jgi:hypothetical protein